MRGSKALMWKCENSLLELKTMIPQLRSWNCHLITCQLTILRFVGIRKTVADSTDTTRGKSQRVMFSCNTNAVVKCCHLTVISLCLSLFLSRILACHLKNAEILLGRSLSFCDDKNVDFACFFTVYCFSLHGTYWVVLHNEHVNSDREMKAAQCPLVWSSKQEPWKIF